MGRFLLGVLVGLFLLSPSGANASGEPFWYRYPLPGGGENGNWLRLVRQGGEIKGLWFRYSSLDGGGVYLVKVKQQKSRWVLVLSENRGKNRQAEFVAFQTIRAGQSAPRLGDPSFILCPPSGDTTNLFERCQAPSFFTKSARRP